MKKMMLVVIATVTAAVFGILALELSCRCLHLGELQRCDDPGLRCRPAQFRPARNMFLGWEYNPETYAGNDAGYKVNSLGFLGREYPAAKGANTYRIIVIGDSITESGWYVRRLEELLNAAGLPMTYEVWNCGVPGFSVSQYCVNLKDKVSRFDPDMVIIGFCLNDLMDMPIVTRDAKGSFTAYVNPIDRRDFEQKNLIINQKLFFSSYAYRVAVNSIHGLTRGDQENESLRHAETIRAMNEYAARRQVKFLAVIFPFLKSSYNKGEQKLYYELRNILAKQQLHFLDLHGVFSHIDDPSWRRVPDDQIHPSEKGHRLAADTIFNYLMCDRDYWLSR